VAWAIAARDGARLRASLYIPEKWNGGAVLVLHGISDSRGSEIGFAHLFGLNGYLVLTPENRAQGESGGNFVTYGVLEGDDVHRWVSWLMAERHPRNVYGLGESLGGAVLIESLGEEHRLNAIVAESAFASLALAARGRASSASPIPGACVCGGLRFLGVPLWTFAVRIGFSQSLAGGCDRGNVNAGVTDSRLE
jgi:uncharacterized protein